MSILDRVSNYFVLCFKDIMVGTRHNPESNGVSDDEIHRMIHDEVAAAIQEAILEMFGSIKTTLIVTFDERYVAVTEADVVAATATIAATRPQGVTRCYTGSSATRSHQRLMGLTIRLL